MAVAHGVPDAQAALRVCQRLAQAPVRRVPELCRAARRVRFRLDVLPRPEPFTAETAPGALEDLRTRLRGMRWPDTPEDAGWSLGTDLGYLREGGGSYPGWFRAAAKTGVARIMVCCRRRGKRWRALFVVPAVDNLSPAEQQHRVEGWSADQRQRDRNEAL